MIWFAFAVLALLLFAAAALADIAYMRDRSSDMDALLKPPAEGDR